MFKATTTRSLTLYAPLPEASPSADQSAVTVPLALPRRLRSVEMVGTTVTCWLPEYSCTLAGAVVVSPAEPSNAGARSGRSSAHAPTDTQMAVATASRLQAHASRPRPAPFVTAVALCFFPMSRCLSIRLFFQFRFL